MTRLPVISSSRHVGHAPAMEIIAGAPIPSIDSVERIDAVRRVMASNPAFQFEEAESCGVEPILAVHSAELLEFFEKVWERQADRRPPGTDFLIADTFLHERLRAGLGPLEAHTGQAGEMGRFTFDTIAAIGPHTYDAMRSSADVAVTAAERIAAGSPAAVALTRPPGHHAGHDLFGGGTFLNNGAIAAQHLIEKGCRRVAILDLDYHHGNGTQSIFYDRKDVFFASIHASPAETYPFFTGWENERGSGPGEGANLNVLLPPDTSGDGYLELLRAPIEAIDEHRPEILIVGLGLDTYVDDPFDGGLRIPDYSRIGAAVAELGIPTLVMLEGGYNLHGVGPGFAAWMNGFVRQHRLEREGVES